MSATVIVADNSDEQREDNYVTPLPRRATTSADRAAVDPDGSASPGTGYAITIPGDPAQAAVLRRHVRFVAALPRDESEVLEQLASELFNNAVIHTRSRLPGGSVTVTVAKLTDPARTQIKVIDDGTEDDSAAPCVQPTDPDRVGGLGMFLVDHYADRWGTLRGPDGRTTVWFEVDRRPPA
ncbi:ATP-binding protein [Marinitenerispora sediminis]|uniref:ATP-binding protein n=1 Tax=Marinitenerispora sediminis TaxID=1931232 RepID=A0A368TBT0_9ACTN|nr:ATP-binding protein [Marinitenerispora sediminis]RCV56667.1 ATP-binding protein [Marinitenerispora sediminis]RCV61659.1 ATP-binding protein [Marinitenerispora sediminis]RCV62609.1 ATP-binding protein [Marinitenerispora sediminis]